MEVSRSLSSNVTRAVMQLSMVWNEALIVDTSQRTTEQAAVGAAGPRGIANARALKRMTSKRPRRKPRRRGQQQLLCNPQRHLQ